MSVGVVVGVGVVVAVCVGVGEGMGTVTEAEPELFAVMESGDEPVAMFVKVVPCGVAGGMLATNVKSALDPAVSVAIVQVIVPFVPTAGTLLQSNAGPLFWFAETKVIPAGSGSVSETVVASLLPTLRMVTSNDTSLPAGAVDGQLFVTARSDCACAEGASPRKMTQAAREKIIV